MTATRNRTFLGTNGKIISEVVMRFCYSPLEAVAILGQAVTFIATEEADQDAWVIQ